MAEIHIIITGGTIDSFYDGTKDTAVPYKHSVIPDYFKRLKLHSKLKFTEICMKDSRSISANDLAAILKTINRSKSRYILITHGTYTMVETGNYLTDKLRSFNKTIVLTGSLIPLVGMTPSDGGFNMGYATAILPFLQPGVYVCMNGKAFTPTEVIKIVPKGRFEKKS